MLINCYYCSARVVADVTERDIDRSFEDKIFAIYLMTCPQCKNVIVGKQQIAYDEHYEELKVGEPTRVWPNPESSFDSSIPSIVQTSLIEAKACLSNNCFTASVVMSGRALEAIARYFHTGEQEKRLMLGKGLEELYESKRIDERLYNWAKELHIHRNLAAHPSEKVFEKQEAEDLYDFLYAICEYLFVLQDRYDQFMKRKLNSETSASAK